METLTDLLAQSGVLKTRLQLTYIRADDDSKTDISEDVSADLLSCEYSDKVEDEADEVSITLKDPEGKWAGSWTPTRGDKVQVTFTTESRGALDTGTMIIDRLSTSGRPRVFQISAVSIPLESTIRRTVKTRNFENADLKTIAQRIADDNNLKLFWDTAEENPTYDRVDQQRVSDLEFLKGLCDDASLTVKVGFEQLIIFDQASYEKKDPVKLLTESGSHLLSWSFEAQQSERYKSCTVRWRKMHAKTRSGTPSQSHIDSLLHPEKQQKKKGSTAARSEDIEYTYEDPNVEESGQQYVIQKRCTSLAEAERIARSTLRKLNLRQLTGSITMVGDPLMSAGSVVALSGFGSFDGNFIIEEASHSMSGSGYITTIAVRRVNTEY